MIQQLRSGTIETIKESPAYITVKRKATKDEALKSVARKALDELVPSDESPMPAGFTSQQWNELVHCAFNGVQVVPSSRLWAEFQ